MREMHATRCLSCQILAGEQEVPGGIVYENSCWIVASKTAPVFFAGNLFLILRRHCEHLAELTPKETASLGPIMQKVCAALTHVLHPVKIYVASYGEGVQHIHFHIIPRTTAMPVGNGAVFLSHQWKAFLYQLGVKKTACSETQILQIIASVRQYVSNETKEKQDDL
jgi:diadenosine tetraphosphate (Ap4A) HIT family hydrolase